MPDEIQRPAASGARAEGISPLEIVHVLLQNRYVIAVPALLLALTVALFVFLQPRTYIARGAFIPQSSERGGSNRLSGLAAQFGFNIGSTGSATSSEFYAALLRSRDLIRPLVEREYKVADRGGRLFWISATERRGTLMDLYEVEADSPFERRELTVEFLRESITASADLETGIVRFGVEVRWPELAQEIAQLLIDQLSAFNVGTRRSQAAAERQFVEERLASAGGELSDAERSLERFLEQNRTFENSPRLRFQHDRLLRTVTMRQQVYTSLLQAYEQARIEEVRDTPVITIVEAPMLPWKPERRGTVFKGSLALGLGGLVGMAFAFGRRGLHEERRTRPDVYEALTATTGDLRNDIRRFLFLPWRRKAR